VILFELVNILHKKRLYQHTAVVVVVVVVVEGVEVVVSVVISSVVSMLSVMPNMAVSNSTFVSDVVSRLAFDCAVD
jgi:hypothetical protein